MFVGGLPPGVGAAEVRGRFAAFGEVGEVVLPPAEAAAGDGGGHRGFAFFDLRADSAAVQRCISIYNGCDWAGHRMCVAQARERWKARFEREAAKDVSAAAEHQAAQERKRAAAAAGGLGATLRPMLLGRGPSGKRLKVRPDGGDDKHRRHRTFFPPGRSRGPVSWECQPRETAEERHRRALGLKSASPASFVLPLRPHVPTAPAVADAGSELQRLLEEGREYVDALGFCEDDGQRGEPGEEAPETGHRGTEELLAHHGYRSESEGDETGSDSGSRGGSLRPVPTSSEDVGPTGREHRIAGASRSETGSESESEHRGSEEATDSDSPSSPELARSPAAPASASPRERSSSLHGTTTSSFLSSSSGLENELDSMAAAQADRDLCPGVARPGRTAVPQAEDPTRSDGRDDSAAAPSSSGATTTTTTDTTSSPTAATASDSTSKSADGEPGEGGDSGEGEAGGLGGRAPVDSGPFMRDQRLDVVVEGWKANWKALDQDWKRKRREALRAERRRRGDL